MKSYNEQLQEEFDDWYKNQKEINPYMVRDWFLSKHTNYLSELREKIKKLEQPKHEHGKDCKNYDDCRMFTRHERSYNKALLDILTLLDNDIQQ